MEGAVVVGVDGSRRGRRTLEWAAREAEMRDCRLLIVHVLLWYRYDLPVFPPGWWEALEAEGRKLLTESEAYVRERYPAVVTETRMPVAHTVTALCKEAEPARAVVVGARGHGGFHNLLLGSTSLHLAGHAACPVVVVRGDTDRPPREIVAGVDGSSASHEALGYALEEARLWEVPVRVVYAWRVPAFGAGTPAMGDEQRERVEREGRGVLDRAIDAWSATYPDVRTVVHLEHGHPASVLVTASEAADLVVVGSRGSGGPEEPALGSTGHAVLHHARCAVAIVRPRREDTRREEDRRDTASVDTARTGR